MADGVRDRMVDGAMALLAQRGLQATSFSEVLAATGAPRGSLYHHFPDGKDQLVAAAVERAGGVLAEAMKRVAGTPAPAVVDRFLAIWRAVLTRSQCQAGCAVLAVAVAGDPGGLLPHATAVFRDWRGLLADLLRQGGVPAEAAEGYAVMLIAAAEGAVVLSRAEQDLAPFEAVAAQLRAQLAALLPAVSRPSRPTP